MNLATTGTVARAFEQYVGMKAPRAHWISLECFVDPYFPGVYAFRARYYRNDGRVDECTFMTKGVAASRITEDDIEEVQFTSWPPARVS
jgi:hypothetical protein